MESSCSACFVLLVQVTQNQPCLRPCLEVLVSKLESLQTAFSSQRKPHREFSSAGKKKKNNDKATEKEKRRSQMTTIEQGKDGESTIKDARKDNGSR